MVTSSVTSGTSGTSSTGTSPVSQDIYNRVQQTLSSQSTSITKLNNTLSKDQTKLSALGQLQSALASFQAIAAGMAPPPLADGQAAAAPDASQISTNIKAFASAYNDLNAKLQALQKGDLKSDTAVNQVVSQLNLMLKTGAGSVSSSAMKAAGLTVDAGGNLNVDDKKLQAALAADPAAVGKLLTNGGKGLADQLAVKTAAYASSASVISHETATVSTEITNINNKRTVLSKALTAQANALVALYTAQAQVAAGGAGGSGSASGSGTTGTLFDMLG